MEEETPKTEDEYTEPIVETTTQRVKETTITLNTLNTGKASAVTETINGFVECVIVNAEKPIRLLINLEEYPGIELFNTKGDNMFGQNYYSLRTQTISNKNEKFNFTDACWVINNKLRCTVEGGMDTIVQIVIRYT